MKLLKGKNVPRRDLTGGTVFESLRNVFAHGVR